MKASGNQPPPLSDFLLSPSELAQEHLPPWEPRGGGKKEPSYESDHADLYLEANVAWPPELASIVAECGSHAAHLGPRAREVMYIAHKKWPMPDGVTVPTI
jgi:hypothetical protein